MEKNCNIVKDLLPSYLKGILSKETYEFICEHLETCDNCKLELEVLKNEIKMEQDDKKKENYLINFLLFIFVFYTSYSLMFINDVTKTLPVPFIFGTVMILLYRNIKVLVASSLVATLLYFVLNGLTPWFLGYYLYILLGGIVGISTRIISSKIALKTRITGIAVVLSILLGLSFIHNLTTGGMYAYRKAYDNYQSYLEKYYPNTNFYDEKLRFDQNERKYVYDLSFYSGPSLNRVTLSTDRKGQVIDKIHTLLVNQYKEYYEFLIYEELLRNYPKEYFTIIVETKFDNGTMPFFPEKKVTTFNLDYLDPLKNSKINIYLKNNVYEDRLINSNDFINKAIYITNVLKKKEISFDEIEFYALGSDYENKAMSLIVEQDTATSAYKDRLVIKGVS